MGDQMVSSQQHDECSWMRTARRCAAARFSQQGLPQKRDEYWRFSDSRALSGPLSIADICPEPIGVFDDLDALRLVFVDGQFDAVQSDALSQSGIQIETLADCAQRDTHWGNALYGHLEAAGQTPVARPFASYNTANATQGCVIHVTAQTDRPVLLIYKAQSGQSDALIHHLMKLEKGANLTLLETGQAGARANTVLEIDIAQEAQFDHIRLQGTRQDRLCVSHIFANLAARAKFKSFTLGGNGQLTRNEAVLHFAGDDAKGSVAGICAGNGRDFHHDDTVFITHDALNGESRQVFKKVLRNGATGVFQGKILVQPDAQKTDGYQISQALLLDDDSQFLAKPELEIYADDVACSHGSTCGAIDENALFYLTSRGIPKAQAQTILMQAFLAEVIEEISDEALAQSIQNALPLFLEQVDRA